MNIEIKSIPHNDQRYITVGDYYDEKGTTRIFISDTTEDYNFLVAVHEMIEWYLTKKRGIKEEDIMSFDLNFTGKGEPGDDKNSPYRKEHKFSTKVEKMLAKQLNVSWKEYDKTLENL